MTTTDDDRLVTVCDACLTASCWHGEFMCSKSRGAGTTKLTVRQLRAANKEHPSYYSKERIARIEGRER